MNLHKTDIVNKTPTSKDRQIKFKTVLLPKHLLKEILMFFFVKYIKWERKAVRRKMPQELSYYCSRDVE